MATSVFFNNFQSSQEQLLIENLVIESIKIYGHDVYYCPRTLNNKDEIYGESSISSYNSQYFVEMYIKNVMGFQGEGDFLSKFNLQIRDQMILTIARRTFYDDIASSAKIDRPREGDLIYFPLNKKIFVVKFVEHESVFYQMGALQMFDLNCELWEYSNESLNTGIPEIDSLEKKYSFDYFAHGIVANDNNILADEDGYAILGEDYDYSTLVGNSFEDNTEIQTESNGILDFSEIDPFSEGNY